MDGRLLMILKVKEEQSYSIYYFESLMSSHWFWYIIPNDTMFNVFYIFFYIYVIASLDKQYQRPLLGRIKKTGHCDVFVAIV